MKRIRRPSDDDIVLTHSVPASLVDGKSMPESWRISVVMVGFDALDEKRLPWWDFCLHGLCACLTSAAFCKELIDRARSVSQLPDAAWNAKL